MADKKQNLEGEEEGASTNVQMAGLIGSNGSHLKDTLPVSTTNTTVSPDQVRSRSRNEDTLPVSTTDGAVCPDQLRWRLRNDDTLPISTTHGAVSPDQVRQRLRNGDTLTGQLDQVHQLLHTSA